MKNIFYKIFSSINEILILLKNNGDIYEINKFGAKWLETSSDVLIGNSLWNSPIIKKVIF